MAQQGWKILKISTHPTLPYVLINSIFYIDNSQNFYLSYSIRHSPQNFYFSYSIRHSPWRAEEWIFQALLSGSVLRLEIEESLV